MKTQKQTKLDFDNTLKKKKARKIDKEMIPNDFIFYNDNQDKKEVIK